MQSALPRRWRGLKTVETALLGGRGPIASSSLNFAREYKRPRELRWATVYLLLRSASSQFAGRGGERLASLEAPPVFAVSGEDPASFPRLDMSPDGIVFRQRGHAPGHAVPALFLCREGWDENNAEYAIKRRAWLCVRRGRTRALARLAFVDSGGRGEIE